MTVLALMRHADTAWSVEGRIQGHADLPLLENVSVALPDACRGMRIVTSPLKRCVQTAALLGALRARLGDEMRENEARGLDFTPLGGESPRVLLSRLRGWLEEVARSRTPTLAITHRGVILVFLAG